MAAGLEDPLEGRPLEAAVAAGGRERVDPAFVRPAAERVRIDAEEAARGPEGQRRVGRTGTAGDWHGRLGSDHEM